jgi:tight adherence protein B
MSLELSVALVTFWGIFGLAFVVASLGSRKSLRLQGRLSRHSVIIAAPRPGRTNRFDVLRQPFGGASPSLARLLSRFSSAKSAEMTLQRADIRISVAVYFLIRVLLAVVACAAVQIVSGLTVAASGAAVAGFMAPRFVISKLAARRSAAFEKVLAETLDLIVGALRAGLGFVQALESTALEQPEPMRGELKRIIDQINLGVSVSDAMESLSTRFDSRDVDLFATAVTINRETGGNLTEVLERLARTVRQRREIRNEAKALTAAPRMTSYVLAVLPFAIAGYSIAASPLYREQLLHAPLGRLILIGAIIWSFIGFFISQKLAKVEY